MRKLFKRFLPSFMAVLMLLSSMAPTFATVTENQTINVNNNAQTEVIYNQESTFGVTIPKLIDLGYDKTTDYSVTIFGDFASDETVFVVPDESFLMKDKNTSNPKADVEATVIQDKTEWKFNELETIGNGNVTAENLTAGIWEGKFYFNIKLKNCNISVTATNEAGENLNAYATYITGSEKDNLLNSLIEEGYVESAEDVDALINVKSDDFDGLADTTFDVSNIYEEGDEIVILHFNEETSEWEYIGTETVNENGLISGDFTSYSPVAFVKVNEDGDYEDVGSEYVEFELTASNYSMAGITREGEVIIPKTFEYNDVNYKTVSIGKNAFYGCTDLISVTIPNSVTTIGTYAFYECTNLSNVNFSNSITNIGTYAFYGCSSLNSIIIPEGVTRIGSNVFQNCTNLANVTMGNNIVNIGSHAFQKCTSLTNIIIPSNVVTIENHAFYDCTSLIEITIPGKVTTIGNSAFKNCTSLTNVIMGDALTTIEPYVFFSCVKLTNIIIPENVTSIGNYAFYKCNNLTNVTFADTSIWYTGNAKGSTTTQVNVTDIEKNATYLTSSYFSKYWTKQ